MRAKYLLTTISVLSLGIAGNVLADDVYVNLSVLDNLQDSSAPVMRAKPLFPIISKSDSQKSVSAKKVRKAKNASAKSSKEKLGIPAKKSVKVEVKETENKPESQLKQLKEVELPEPKTVTDTGPFKVAPVEPKTDSVQAAPSVPVKSETLPIEEKKIDEQKQNKVVAPMTSSASEENTSSLIVKMPNSESKEEKNEKLLSTEEIKKENKTEISSKTEDTSSELQKELDDINQKQVSQSVINKEEQPSLLINTSQTAIAQNEPSKSEIFFAEGSDELTTENEGEIDNIINSFENAKENKIAIYSFNLDDGNDSFRKKRISLNRAIAVRSYLLGKGYKNFSIKVVNLDEANGKENSIRIEELK